MNITTFINLSCRAIQFSHDFFLTKTPKLTILRDAENKIHIQKKRVNPIFFNKLIVHILGIYCPATIKMSDYHL